MITEHGVELEKSRALTARIFARIDAWRHRNDIHIFAEGRSVFIPREELERIRVDAETLSTSIRESDARRQRELTPPPLPTALPAAPFAEDVRRPYPIAAPEAEDAARVSFGRMIDAACDNDWASVSVQDYPRLNDKDLAALDAIVLRLRGGCSRNLLERLIAMRRAGATLDMDRLRAEVISAQSSLNSPEVIEPLPREDVRPGTGYNPCIDDGNTCLRR